MNKNFKYNLAKFISKITTAPLMAMPAFFILNLAFLKFNPNFAVIEFAAKRG